MGYYQKPKLLNQFSIKDIKKMQKITDYLFILLFIGLIGCNGDSGSITVPEVLTIDGDPTSNQVDISWGREAGATRYELYRSTSKDDDTPDLVYNGNEIKFGDKTVEPGTTYYYTLKTCDNVSCSDFSNYVVVNTPNPEGAPKKNPEKPTVAVKNSSQIDISWARVDEATSYEVHRATLEGSGYQKISGDSLTETTYSDTGLSAGATYYYKISACSDSSGQVVCTGFSDPGNATTTPQSPEKPTVSAKSSSRIVINWASVTGATSYEVHRSTSQDSDYSKLESYDGTSLNYNDTELDAGTAYYYKIKSCNDNGCSDFSSIASDTTTPKSPEKPTVTVKSSTNRISSSEINISWASVTGANSYQVHRSTSEGSGYQKISGGSLTETTYNDYGTSVGTYYYKVKACNASGCSSFSSFASISYKDAYTLNSVTMTVKADNETQLINEEHSFFIEIEHLQNSANICESPEVTAPIPYASSSNPPVIFTPKNTCGLLTVGGIYELRLLEVDSDTSNVLIVSVSFVLPYGASSYPIKQSELFEGNSIDFNFQFSLK